MFVVSKKHRVVLISSLSLVFGCAQGVSGGSVNGAAKGGILGAALGAGTGAIVGNQTGDPGVGVAIGAGIGAVTGALIGNTIDNQNEANARVESQVAKNQEQIEENKRLIEELRKRGADVRSSKRGVVINLPDILFQFDSANLTPEAHRTLDEISDVLTGVKDRQISIEGHTDSIGSVSYNKDLSLRRARSVANKAHSRGVNKAQVSVVGYGEGAPISTNNTDAGRSRNRRVEVIIEN
jgi:outer membrane protein OmpA-like peptidoglycan-associated protein